MADIAQGRRVMPRQLTPKQVLWEHVREHHDLHYRPANNVTYRQLQRWHEKRHHLDAPNHWHGSDPSLDPFDRPAGWDTGLDMHMKPPTPVAVKHKPKERK